MKNVGASVLAHLKNISVSGGQDMAQLIRLYAQQRLLYRISVSDIAPKFCLKGGLMLAVYNDGVPMRSSEDVDFNALLEGGMAEVEDAIRHAVSTPVPDDGVRFDLQHMRALKEHVGRIKGAKVSFYAYVHTARIQMRVDVGFDNIITPDPLPIEIPTLLPNLVPCPVISGYPLETIIAEKLHAVRQFGMDNTRHKDLFDLWRIQGSYELAGSVVSEAVLKTFRHQGSLIERNLPGLSEAYVEMNGQAWNAFLRKNGLRASDDFPEVARQLRDFADPIMDAANGKLLLGTWYPLSGWEQYAANYAP
jgi:predicted nucleotidyltransferase component of viral defense system